jgi:DNA-binding NarL/FixJ family response regulator
VKCIIADDERLVRYSIQDMLEEIADAGVAWFDEISQVVNGKDLLRQVRVVQPELVFVDIRMPLLSGLDAIEKGRELSPRTQWIILTGYAEFDYAKRAIALGALDYLLKPASRSDIERIVRLALSRLADRRAREQLALEHRILGLLQDTFSEDPESLSEIAYAGLLLTLDSPLPLKEASVMQKQALQNLRSWLRTGLPSSGTGGVAVLEDGNMICVISAPCENELQDIAWKVIDYSLTTLAQDSSCEVVCTVFLVKTTGAHLTGLLAELNHASRDSSLRLLGGLGQIMDGGLRESLTAGFGKILAVLSPVDRALRNRELVPEEAVQVLHRHRSELEKLWNTSDLCRFFEVRSAMDLGGLEPGPALDTIIAWCGTGLLPGSSANETTRRRLLVQRALDLLAEQYTHEIGLA